MGMERYNIFSPFYYKTHIEETEYLKQIHLEAMLINYNAFPHHSHDWNVHTSYSGDTNLPYKINFEHFFLTYAPYIDEFLSNFYGRGKDWEVVDNIWHNVDGKKQDGMQHNHLGSDFSAVHYLKFNPNEHTGTTFVNPRSNEAFYYKNLNGKAVDGMNGDNPNHSLYFDRFTPQVVEGDFIIFPSHLDHLIYKNESDDLRVTMAMNFKLM